MEFIEQVGDSEPGSTKSEDGDTRVFRERIVHF
jgi:hypothetical protein